MCTLLSANGSARTYSDPIHGTFDFPIKFFDIIDTPEFQRLRSVKQLGTGQWVYSSASNTRFTHSLGTSYLADKWVSLFRSRQPELEITDWHQTVVATAGLVHDLGHGPFSHLFESWMHSRGLTHWSHEDMSCRMFEQLVDANALDFERDAVRAVQNLISGKPMNADAPQWYTEIVANPRTSIDVDKFDYLERDCHHLGIRSTFQTTRLLDHSRVIDDRICFDEKEAFNIYELFHTRFSLHKRAYGHRVIGAVDHMVTDIFTLADTELKIAERAQDPARYHLLTDDILSEIRRSSRRALKPARDLVDRLDRRNLYVMVDELLVSIDQYDVRLKSISAADIAGYTKDGSLLTAEDLIVDHRSMNYAMRDQNPVASARFYSKSAPESSFGLEREDVSNLIPSTFQEILIRIYLRDKEKLSDARKAVDAWKHARHIGYRRPVIKYK